MLKVIIRLKFKTFILTVLRQSECKNPSFGYDVFMSIGLIIFLLYLIEIEIEIEIENRKSKIETFSNFGLYL